MYILNVRITPIMPFVKDLHESREQENQLADYYRNLNYYKVDTTQDKELFPDYDVKVQQCETCIPFTIEVKYDKMAAKTGNVAVELYKRKAGKKVPSGLSASAADYWVYTFLNDSGFYFITKDKLARLVDDKLYKRKVTGGDNNAVSLALFDKEFFIDQCNVVYTSSNSGINTTYNQTISNPPKFS